MNDLSELTRMCPVHQFKSKTNIFRCGAQPDVRPLRVLPYAHVVALLDRIQPFLFNKSRRYSI